MCYLVSGLTLVSLILNAGWQTLIESYPGTLPSEEHIRVINDCAPGMIQLSLERNQLV
jgi:hypothetical protein